jgi:alpha,alpha-trehalase
LATRCPTAIVSGRDLDDVRSMVGIDGLWYAGSHGFDLLAPDGQRNAYEGGRDALPALDEAAAELEDAIGEIAEAWVERKRYAIAVHYRQTPDELVPRLEAIVRDVADRHDTLRMTGGKRIFELRPDIDWDKGRALDRILRIVAPDEQNTVPIYLGDDETDEDAFREVRERGWGIVVGAGDRPTAAHSRLRDTDEVTQFLSKLAEEAAS